MFCKVVIPATEALVTLFRRQKLGYSFIFSIVFLSQYIVVFGEVVVSETPGMFPHSFQLYTTALILL